MRMVSTRDIYGDTLVELGMLRDDLVVLDADVSKATRSAVFAKRFPGRFFNAGVAEQNLVGVAAGLALSGLLPYASTFAVFMAGRAFEQIRNTVAYARVNVKLVGTHGGITVGADGASHQSVEDLALMRSLPGMVVLVPSDANQARQAVFKAAAWSGPVYIRLGRAPTPLIYPCDCSFEIGRANVLREGRDVSLMASGCMLHTALEAADALSREGIGAEVIDVPTLKPLDSSTIAMSARKTRAVVTVEEHSVIGGLGAAVSEFLISSNPVPLVRVGLPDAFGQSGEPEELMDFYGLSTKHVVMAVKKALNLRDRRTSSAFHDCLC